MEWLLIKIQDQSEQRSLPLVCLNGTISKAACQLDVGRLENGLVMTVLLINITVPCKLFKDKNVKNMKEIKILMDKTMGL